MWHRAHSGLDYPKYYWEKDSTDTKYMHTCLLPQSTPAPAYTLCPHQPTYRFAIFFWCTASSEK